MKRIIYIALVGSLCFGALCSCARDRALPPESNEVTLTGISDQQWTYFSFETGKAVGTGRFGSDEDDAAWAARDDWDLAFCGEFLRTNSGTSGGGRGGILRDETTNFFNLTEAPSDGYTTDIDDRVIRH